MAGVGGLNDMRSKSHRNEHLADAKGSMADEEKTGRLNFNIPASTMNAFKAKCYADGETMKTVVLKFIEDYIKT